MKTDSVLLSVAIDLLERIKDSDLGDALSEDILREIDDFLDSID